MTNSQEPHRQKFAPIPIESMFERYRQAGAAAEPTPSPSPRSPLPPPREKRKLAPQLVESSVRRSRRVGDEGPAPKPTDRTDITPFTKNIYFPRSRKRPGNSVTPTSRLPGHARRESCDDLIAEDVFDLVARDAQRKLEEVALSAFPNSGLRIGGAEHFYVGEGSDDDSSPSRGRATKSGPGVDRESRRDSSEEDVGWAAKEMQEHAHSLATKKTRERISTLDLDKMSIDSPPNDAMGLTRGPRHSMTNSPAWQARQSSSLGLIGETHMALIRSDSPLATIGKAVLPLKSPESLPIRPIGESHMPYIPCAPPGKAAHLPYMPASQIEAEMGFRTNASPFRRLGHDRDMSLERARNYHRLRALASPLMLGKDLTFRMCPSPKATKLEPDHLWDLEKGRTVEEQNRDRTEEHGLWRGYCYSADRGENLAVEYRPAGIHTPCMPSTPGDPSKDLGWHSPPNTLSSEPLSIQSASRMNSMNSMNFPVLPEHRYRNEVKGIHMLSGLDERLGREKANADLEEKIHSEFTDTFVTQVYNYLSLGYPALARQYDEELSKISRISILELQQDDESIMRNLWEPDSNERVTKSRRTKATGHIMVDSKEKEGVREEDRCPRWKALKLYIFEWARQHPDLDAISPLAWGVRERRGSWAL